MDDQLKNKVMIAIVAFNAGFLLWWNFMAGSWLWGGLMSLIVGAVLGGIAWGVSSVLS